VIARPRLLVAVIAGMAVVMSACQPASPGDTPGGPSELPSAGPVQSSPAASSRAASSAGASPAGASPIVTFAPLAVDAGLLRVLPPTAGKVTMTADPENATQLIGDPTLGATASGLAVARYATGDDIMVVSVMQLRPGIFSDGFYETWRKEYDGSACQPAGGTTGAEQVEMIGSLVVHVGACTDGATTYHTVLDGDVLVSAIAVGAGTLGHDVMAGLQP
jgi:hypothetical protein